MGLGWGRELTLLVGEGRSEDPQGRGALARAPQAILGGEGKLGDWALVEGIAPLRFPYLLPAPSCPSRLAPNNPCRLNPQL